MTLYHSYTPVPPMAQYVDSIWLYEEDNPSHAKERVLPQGSMQLLINLHEDRLRVYDQWHHDQFQSFRGCLLNGPQSTFSIIDTSCQASIMGIHFKPAGAFPFLPLPIAELHNIHLSLDVIWGASANDLRNQLLEAQTTEQRFHVLEQFLLARMTHPPASHPAVSFALKEFQSASQIHTIADMTKQLGLSSKRFIQIFHTEVGLTPKLFWRIQRFQEVLRLIRTGREVEWTDIAAMCGYFDQAHFIHDFRTFSGLNPTAYLTHQSMHHNHVPLED